MAKICFMKEGLIGRADPVAEKPLVWCIEKLSLQRADWWADLETKFRIDKGLSFHRTLVCAEFCAGRNSVGR